MNISRQTNSRTMQLLNPPRVDGIEKSLSTRSCSVQKVGEAPFAFPWRPSSYLLCFSYPSPSLSLSLHLFHSSRFPSSSFFSLSLSFSRVHGGLTVSAATLVSTDAPPPGLRASCQANHHPPFFA